MSTTKQEILRLLREEGRARFSDLHGGTGRGSKTALMKLLVELRENGEVFEPIAVHFTAVEGGA